MPTPLTDVLEASERELTQENWHAIEGGNGMCGCGTDKGICSQRLQSFLRQSQVKLLEVVITEVEGMRKDFDAHFKEITHADEDLKRIQARSMEIGHAEMREDIILRLRSLINEKE